VNDCPAFGFPRVLGTVGRSPSPWWSRVRGPVELEPPELEPPVLDSLAALLVEDPSVLDDVDAEELGDVEDEGEGEEAAAPGVCAASRGGNSLGPLTVGLPVALPRPGRRAFRAGNGDFDVVRVRFLVPPFCPFVETRGGGTALAGPALLDALGATARSRACAADPPPRNFSAWLVPRAAPLPPPPAPSTWSPAGASAGDSPLSSASARGTSKRAAWFWPRRREAETSLCSVSAKGALEAVPPRPAGPAPVPATPVSREDAGRAPAARVLVAIQKW
jgi:hypothetical protein